MAEYSLGKRLRQVLYITKLTEAPTPSPASSEPAGADLAPSYPCRPDHRPHLGPRLGARWSAGWPGRRPSRSPGRTLAPHLRVPGIRRRRALLHPPRPARAPSPRGGSFRSSRGALGRVGRAGRRQSPVPHWQPDRADSAGPALRSGRRGNHHPVCRLGGGHRGRGAAESLAPTLEARSARLSRAHARRRHGVSGLPAHLEPGLSVVTRIHVFYFSECSASYRSEPEDRYRGNEIQMGAAFCFERPFRIVCPPCVWRRCR